MYTEYITQFIDRLVDNGNFKLWGARKLHTDRRTFLFDGGLPTRKQAERSTRYQSLLNDYTRESMGKSLNLPPPFIVLVCQQTLLRLSRDRGFNVHVVPGEADGFCVRLAKEDEASYILSADADFLVYTSEAGNFTPLQKFPTQWNEILSFPVYSHIRKELGVSRANGMVEIAALLNEGAGLNVPQCIACVNKNQTLDYMSRKTLHEYISTYMAIEDFSPAPEIREMLNAGVLSGRVTELFFENEAPTYWLPLLPTSNPPRRTAWVISRPIRQAAYYQLRKRGWIRSDFVIEMVQRGQRVAEERVPIEELDDVCVVEDREQIFVTAIRILLRNVPEKNFRYLLCFAGMFVLLQQSNPRTRSASMPPELEYITQQYQTIIYSLIILRQTQSPFSTDIPEFVSLWDLPRFKIAMAAPIGEGTELWRRITANLDPALQNLCGSESSTTASHSPKKIKKPKSADVISNADSDQGNRFSRLAMLSPQGD